MASFGAFRPQMAVAVVSLLLLSAQCVLAGKNVIFSQVVHRHGARTALVSCNLTLICGGPWSACGQLNDPGKLMLEQVGAWARQRYILSDDPTMNYLAGEEYSPSIIYARSTDLDRTLQSADGFLRGLFPDMGTFFPVIRSVSFWTDDLLLVDALAAFYVPFIANQGKDQSELDEFILTMMTADQIRAVGRELSLYSPCNDSLPLAGCALEAQDVAASYNSVALPGTNTSKLTEFPLAASRYSNLSAVRHRWNRLHLAYNESNPIDAARGSFGQNIAQELVLSMRQRINGTAPKPFLFKEYSAHDTTVMPLCATLGHNDMMLPLFGQSYFFELLNDTAAVNGSAQYSVRAFYGSPEQTPGSYEFDALPLPLNCVNASGAIYQTSEDCPLEDFARYIDLSKPRNAAGLCFVESSVLESISCQATNESVPENSLCPFYRTRCPDVACGTGLYYNSSMSTCDPISRPLLGIHAETAAAMTLAAALAGGLIGAVIMAWIAKRRMGYTKLDAQ